MVKNDSNKNYSMKIAGILVVISVGAIFVAFILGVLGTRVSIDKAFRPIEVSLPNLSSNVDSENTKGLDNLVSRSKSGCNIPTIETEAGSIEIYEISVDETYEMPLCFTDDDLNGLNAAVTYKLLVKGGYQPMCGLSYADILQPDFCGQPRTDKGDLIIQWYDLGKPADCDCCTCKIWEAVFIDVCPDKVCLVSSQPPVLIPDCMTMWGVDYIDSKEVKLDLNIKWKGCWFWTISSSDLQVP